VEPVDSARSLPARRISYSDLYSLVADVVSALCALDVCPGDRIASYSSNCVVSHRYCPRRTEFNLGAHRKIVLPYWPQQQLVSVSPSSRLRFTFQVQFGLALLPISVRMVFLKGTFYQQPWALSLTPFVPDSSKSHQKYYLQSMQSCMLAAAIQYTLII
jgi:hypothetical protein